MASKKSLDQRKKLLQEALDAHENYEATLDKIKELEKKLAAKDNSSKMAAENAKLKKQAEAHKHTILELQKKCEELENDKKKDAEKIGVLKHEIHMKDQALQKHKMRMASAERKQENNKDTEELELQLNEKSKHIVLLKEQLRDQEHLLATADEWAQKCAGDKEKLEEEVKKLKESEKSDNSDAYAKILSLEEVIIDRERELKKYQVHLDQMRAYCIEAQKQLAEVPKLKSEIQSLQQELDAHKFKYDNISLFSNPPPTVTPLPPYNFNIPPPPIAKPMEQPHNPLKLNDIEKQMNAMAAEISRLKHMNGAQKPMDPFPRK